MKQLLILLAWWMVVIGAANAQMPSYRPIGENELAGLDLYSIAQDNKDNIWIATNKGLIKYDGYSYKYYMNEDLRNQSLFALTFDKKGQLFAHNLGGQIVTMREDSLYVFFEIPDSLLTYEFSIAFDESNDLIVWSKAFFKVNAAKQIEILPYSMDANYYGAIGIASFENKIHVSFVNDPIPTKISGWKMREWHFSYNCKFVGTSSSSFSSSSKNCWVPSIYHNQLYWTLLNAHEVLFPVEGHLEYKKMQVPEAYQNEFSQQFYVSNAGQKLWFTSRKGGILVFDRAGNPLYGGKKLFEEFYISGFLEDREGNCWLLTLGDGILFIANTEFINFRNHSLLSSERILKVTHDHKGSLYAGSEKGKIFNIDSQNNISIYYEGAMEKISFLDFFVHKNSVFTSTKGSLVHINKNNKIELDFLSMGAIKDIESIDQYSYIVAHARGVNVVNEKADLKVEEYLKDVRIKTIYYDAQKTIIWAGGNVGLFKIQNGQAEKVLFEEKAIVTVDIVGNSEKIWIATSSKGILELLPNGLFHWTDIPLLSNNIQKLLLIKDKLYIAHEKGLQIYDIRSKKIRNINQTHGLASSNISDFSVFGQQIAIVTNRGLQLINIENLTENEHPPFLEFEWAKVDDMLFDMDSINFFAYNSNRFAFRFKAKAYRHQGALQYLYRLEGYDNVWRKAGPDQNEVDYASLAAGKYNFRVVAVNENGILSNELSYSFSINTPIWLRWWFYLILLLIVFGTGVWIYRKQVARIKKKSSREREFIHFKLTALKSQMNPHFIFNALNSIQDLILKQDIDNSYDYITKFANLVRRTLNYSEKEFILIEDELILLELYLELEKLRFKENFEYTITTQNIENLSVPPMLVQPFIENAIKHGLMHHKGPKKLSIEFSLQSDETLLCVVTDNGIGRERSAEINERRSSLRTSFSVKSIETRLEILQKYYNSNLGIHYDDLKDEQGEALGTRVSLNIPYQRDL